MARINKIYAANLVCYKYCFGVSSISQRYYSNAADKAWASAKPLSEMPGYTKWGIFRAFLPGGMLHNKDFLGITEATRKEFGDISFIPGLMGLPNRVTTYNPDDFEHIYRTEGVWPVRKAFMTVIYHRLHHRRQYFDGAVGVLASNHEEWGKFRSTINPVLMQPKTIKQYIGRMSTVSDEFVQRIKDIRDSKTLEVPVDFETEINHWALENVAVVALDKHLGLLSSKGNNAEAMEFFKHLSKFFDLFTDLEVRLPAWKYLQTSNFKSMMTALDGITDFTDKHIKEAIEKYKAEGSNNKPDAEKSVLEKLLAINEKVAIITAMDMFFGGVDTTTTTLAGILLALSKFPEKQEKLREEIFKLMPDKDEPLTEESMKNMPYLRACLKESLRMYPLGLGTVRHTVNDIVLSGYRVPKGTDVTMINYRLLRDPNQFPEPDQFKPERWLRQADKTTDKQHHPFAYFPFSFGPRSCVGKRIVEMELEIGLAKILRNFKVEFNHPSENLFKSVLIFTPAKPLTFKFTDI